MNVVSIEGTSVVMEVLPDKKTGPVYLIQKDNNRVFLSVCFGLVFFYPSSKVGKNGISSNVCDHPKW